MGLVEPMARGALMAGEKRRKKLGTLNTKWSWEKPLPLEAKLEEFCLGLK